MTLSAKNLGLSVGGQKIGIFLSHSTHWPGSGCDNCGWCVGSGPVTWLTTAALLLHAWAWQALALLPSDGLTVCAAV